MKNPSEARERSEDLERASLSTWAVAAVESKGRDRFEEPDPLRTAFQVDRDRILGSAAVRALAGKADLLGTGRTRLDLVREVAVGVRAAARALRLNEDLTEAIALGMDLGHPPYGEAGVSALGPLDAHRAATGGRVGFSVAEQSLRVVELHETDGTGLNLSFEVRDGIVGADPAAPPPATLEGRLVRVLAEAFSLIRLHAVAADLGALQLSLQRLAGPLGSDAPARRSAVVRAVVEASADEPEVRLTADVERVLTAVAEDVRPVWAASLPAAAPRLRAEHVLRSLAMFYEQHPTALRAHTHPDEIPSAEPVEPGTPRHHERRLAIVDHLCALPDEAATAEFAARFTP